MFTDLRMILIIYDDPPGFRESNFQWTSLILMNIINTNIWREIMLSLFIALIMVFDSLADPVPDSLAPRGRFEPLQLPVEVILISPPSGQMYIEELWRIHLFNTSSETYHAYLFTLIEKSGEGILMEATTSVFLLPPGLLVLSSAELSPINTEFFNSEFQDAVERMGAFPDGDYTVTIFVYEEGGGLLGQGGYIQNVEQYSPPLLTYPFDETAILEPLPVFSWFPSLPQGICEYSLRIVEVNEYQSPESAISANPGWFIADNLIMEEFPYPVYADAFREGHEYAWMVEAFYGDVSAGKSEVWTFTSGSMTDEAGGTELWSFETGGDVICSPALAPDGSIICGSSDGFIYSIDLEGTELWRYPAGGAVYSVVIGPYLNIYSTGEFGVCCLDPIGSLLWRNRDTGLIEASPVIIPGGRMLVGTADGNFYVFDTKGGCVIDSVFTGTGLTLPAAIDSTGMIFFAGGDRRIYAVEYETEVTQRWTFQADEPISGGPIISGGFIYASYGRYVCCFDMAGVQKWNSSLPSNVLAGPVVSGNGTVYVGTAGGNIFVLEGETGSRIGIMHAAGRAICSTPALNASGTLFFGADDGYLHSFSPAGFRVWEFETGGVIRSSPAVGIDGTIYFGSSDHMIYAVEGPVAGPMTAGWPKFCLNNHNNGHISNGEEEL